jgi:hypothetical protein
MPPADGKTARCVRLPNQRQTSGEYTVRFVHDPKAGIFRLKTNDERHRRDLTREITQE